MTIKRAENRRIEARNPTRKKEGTEKAEGTFNITQQNVIRLSKQPYGITTYNYVRILSSKSLSF